MSTPESHLRFLRASFEIQCSTSIFTEEELQLLSDYGSWMQALATGQIEPYTVAQRRFISCLGGEFEPESQFELVFTRYQARCALEEENYLQTRYEVFDPAERWFPRSEHWRKK